MDNDFDSVSWQNEADSDNSRPTTSQTAASDEVYGSNASGKRKASSNSQQAGRNADNVDLAGIGSGRLDCTVDTPLKENDGSKDTYVSYLVTTHVCVQFLWQFLRPIEKLTKTTRPISRRSRNQSSKYGVVSQTSYSYTKSFASNILNALCLRCQTSTRWNM